MSHPTLISILLISCHSQLLSPHPNQSTPLIQSVCLCHMSYTPHTSPTHLSNSPLPLITPTHVFYSHLLFVSPRGLFHLFHLSGLCAMNASSRSMVSLTRLIRPANEVSSGLAAASTYHTNPKRLSIPPHVIAILTCLIRLDYTPLRTTQSRHSHPLYYWIVFANRYTQI